jgi:leucyl aminopeptidase
MDFAARNGTAGAVRTDCVIVGVYQGGRLGQAAQELDAVANRTVTQLVKRGDVTGKPGTTLLVPSVAGITPLRVLVVGLGERGKLDIRGWRKAHATAVRALLGTGAKNAFSFLSMEDVADADPYLLARHAAEAAAETAYRFDEMKSKLEDPLPPFARLTLWVADRKSQRAAELGFEHGKAVAEGQSLARRLGNLPGNVCTPTFLAGEAQRLAKGVPGLTVSVVEEAEMRELGMNALLAVARGSREPPKLIVMEWRGGPKQRAPIALVGKGITFDTGGVSLKPPPAMDEMKFDMCGGAAVIGVMATVARLELPINVVGLVPAAENMPDGMATRPGDIVTTMSGQTVEILNTDAEGRLVLCDALTYVRRFEPNTVLDIATLTGACVIALGYHLTGLMSSDDTLARELLRAGTEADDRAWHLPIGEEYDEQLKSNFADFANIAGREGGAITAACFLARFTRGLRWAHLDVAGTAWKTDKAKGATGRPVPLLAQFLMSRAGVA